MAAALTVWKQVAAGLNCEKTQFANLKVHALSCAAHPYMPKKAAFFLDHETSNRLFDASTCVLLVAQYTPSRLN